MPIFFSELVECQMPEGGFEEVPPLTPKVVPPTFAPHGGEAAAAQPAAWQDQGRLGDP